MTTAEKIASGDLRNFARGEGFVAGPYGPIPAPGEYDTLTPEQKAEFRVAQAARNAGESAARMPSAIASTRKERGSLSDIDMADLGHRN